MGKRPQLLHALLKPAGVGHSALLRTATVTLLLAAAIGIYAWLLRGKPEPSTLPVGSVQSPRQEPAPARSAVAGADPDLGAHARAPVRDEATLMQQLRENIRSDPVLAEALAREGRLLYPNSADSDERDALLVDALINQERIGVARSETYYYLDHHPNGRYLRHLFVMTGIHPEPELRQP